MGIIIIFHSKNLPQTWEKTTKLCFTPEKSSTTHFSTESRSKLKSSIQTRVVYQRLKLRINLLAFSSHQRLLLRTFQFLDSVPNSVVEEQQDLHSSMITLM